MLLHLVILIGVHPGCWSEIFVYRNAAFIVAGRVVNGLFWGREVWMHGWKFCVKTKGNKVINILVDSIPINLAFRSLWAAELQNYGP